MLKTKDVIYGEVILQEKVLVDLLSSQALGRLQGVLQHGISGLIGITSPVTRFEHSLGAMILVRRLGGSLKEQIAALLHDVSHTAFSHVIDYVFDNHDGQSYHDEQKETFLVGTDVPAILYSHGYDWNDFLDETRYPILEQPSPHLCADRLDYFLRDAIELGLAEEADIQAVLQNIVIMDEQMVVISPEVAEWLGFTFMAADEASWANFREVGVYEVTARAIRRGLDSGAIDEADIWGTDQELWNKLKNSPDAELQNWLHLVSKETKFVWDEQNPTFRISTKLRTIDPDIAINGELRPLSALNHDFAVQREAYLTRKAGLWPMRVIPPKSALS